MKHHTLRAESKGQAPKKLPKKSQYESEQPSESLPFYNNQDKNRHQFHEIVDKFREQEFSSERLYKLDGSTSLPTEQEVVAHLMLLRSLGALKEKIESEPNPPLYTKNANQETPLIEKEKKWQVYVTNAVRRFILFVDKISLFAGCKVDETAFFDEGWKAHFSHTKRKTRIFNIVPPLDILMVWHSFMLNPTSFYDTFARLNLLQFAYLPFPLLKVAKAIDRYSFEYLPQEKQILDFEKYYEISYTEKWNEIMSKSLKVRCPECSKVVCETPYTNASKTGFADPAFECEVKYPCEHMELRSKVTHNRLRSQNMIKDMKSPLIMPNMFKNFSSVLCSKNKRNKSLISTVYSKSEIVKNELKKLHESVSEFRNPIAVIGMVPFDVRFVTRISIRDYCNANLIYLTTDETDKSPEILEDLVGCVIRQMRFVENMNSIDWLHSSHLNITTAEAEMRYLRFFKLLTDKSIKQVLVPTLDIDLFWHTHQLSPYNYIKSCKDRPKNRIIDHNDKYPETYLNDAFEFTQKIYKKKFREEYSLCFCSYCTEKRILWLKEKRTIFKKQKHLKYEAAVDQNVLTSSGLGHISDHNVIIFSLESDESDNEIDLTKYPWTEYVEGERIYVNQPQKPIRKCDSSLWSKNGREKGACGGTRTCGSAGFVVVGAGAYSNCVGNLGCGSGSTAACGGAGCGAGGAFGGGCGGGGGGGCGGGGGGGGCGGGGGGGGGGCGGGGGGGGGCGGGS